MFQPKLASSASSGNADVFEGLPAFDGNLLEGARRDIFWGWLSALLPGCKVVKEHRLLDGGRADLVIMVDDVVRVVIEFKQDVRLIPDRDQGFRYAVNVFESQLTEETDKKALEHGTVSKQNTPGIKRQRRKN